MKVTMSYSVDLGDVPLKVEELVRDCGKQLESLSLTIRSLEVTHAEQFLIRADNIRKKLYFIDNRMNDCVSLMEGYTTAIENLKQQEQANLSNDSGAVMNQTEVQLKESLEAVNAKLEDMDNILENE